MPGPRRHQGDTKTFDELTYAEQAKSINAQIVEIQRSIAAHLRRAGTEGRDVQSARRKCINQLRRLLDRVLGQPRSAPTN